jgi:hypothetical protein
MRNACEHFLKVFHGFSTALAEELAAPNVLSCQATEWKESFFFDITPKKTQLLIKLLTVPRINKNVHCSIQGLGFYIQRFWNLLSQGLTKPRINIDLYCSIQGLGFYIQRFKKNQLVAATQTLALESNLCVCVYIPGNMAGTWPRVSDVITNLRIGVGGGGRFSSDILIILVICKSNQTECVFVKAPGLSSIEMCMHGCWRFLICMQNLSQNVLKKNFRFSLHFLFYVFKISFWFCLSFCVFSFLSSSFPSNSPITSIFTCMLSF